MSPMAAQANPNPNKALWEKGDFTRIAATMRDSGEALVKTLRIEPSLKILDLGCGDGTTALPAVRRCATSCRRCSKRRTSADARTLPRFPPRSCGSPWR